MRVRADTIQDADAGDQTESAPVISRTSTEMEYIATSVSGDPDPAESTTVASLDGGVDGDAPYSGGDFQLFGGTNSALGDITVPDPELATQFTEDAYAGDTVFGSAGNDIISGGFGDDVLFGAAGDDVIGGGLGSDHLRGDEGDDLIFGGTGNDYVNGGADNDHLLGENGNDTLSGDGGNDFIEGGDGIDTLVGGAGDDSLLGGNDADSLLGGAGNDVLLGDVLGGGLSGGDDVLYGDDGHDELFGQGGDDQLNGGYGADTLTGGAGRDTFVFTEVGLQTWYGDERDTIADFNGNPFSGDRIDLRALFDQFTNFTGTTADQAWAQGYLYFVEHGNPGEAGFGTTVYIDPNGKAPDEPTYYGGPYDVAVVDLEGVSRSDISAIGGSFYGLANNFLV